MCEFCSRLLLLLYTYFVDAVFVSVSASLCVCRRLVVWLDHSLRMFMTIVAELWFSLSFIQLAFALQLRFVGFSINTFTRRRRRHAFYWIYYCRSFDSLLHVFQYSELFAHLSSLSFVERILWEYSRVSVCDWSVAMDDIHDDWLVEEQKQKKNCHDGVRQRNGHQRTHQFEQ